jgi:hypothetical protein
MAKRMGHVNPDEVDLYEVKTPSGSSLRVMTDEEAKFYNDNKKKYLEQYKLSTVSDVQEIERILLMETMCHRWQTWLTQGFDYDEGLISAEEMRRNIKDYSAEIRQCKQSLGIDRVTRQKDKGEDVASYIDNLRVRAREFGIMRNQQAAMAIQLFKEAETLIGLYYRTDNPEREYLHLNREEIFKWFVEVAIPKMNKIDEEFRQTSQKMWIRQI